MRDHRDPKAVKTDGNTSNGTADGSASQQPY